ncbi:hypothetical protein [Pseudophaeobacter sp. A-200-2]|uniref:hypothetical protein n=1 Tax=Pseudophaeobacter sp. A-200-2 TaxID=3098145 RepID=UPI0034D6E42A
MLHDVRRSGIYQEVRFSAARFLQNFSKNKLKQLTKNSPSYHVGNLSGQEFDLGVVRIFFLLAIAAAAWTAWTISNRVNDERKQTEYIAFLASDAHVIVGKRTIRIPYIALPGYTASKQSFSLDRSGGRERSKARLEAFREAADRRETAPELDKLEIRVRAFGWNDFNPSFSNICSQLTTHWAKSVCDNPWAPLTQALPRNRFYLSDAEALAAFDNHWTVGKERVGDQLRAMEIHRKTASIECDGTATNSGTRFCTAAMRIDSRLIAVWTVWSSLEETPLQMAERESLAIQSFIEYAISPNENFETLLSRVCELRAPGSVDHPNRPKSGCN